MGLMKLKLIPSCTQQPRTVSFRATTTTTTLTTNKKDDNDVYKTINSVYNYFDPELAAVDDSVETPESWFTHSSESTTSTSTTTEYDELEAIIRGAQQRSTTDQHRLFFEPGGETSSIMSDHESSSSSSPRLLLKSVTSGPNILSLTSTRRQKVETAPTFLSPLPSKASVMLAMESEDPYGDFKRSMEEMMESLGVRDDDWESLEELLGWYLKVNGKSNHGYIVRAFVDLIADGIIDDDVVVVANNDNSINDENCKSATSFSSAASSLPSPASTSAPLLEENSDHPICDLFGSFNTNTCTIQE